MKNKITPNYDESFYVKRHSDEQNQGESSYIDSSEYEKLQYEQSQDEQDNDPIITMKQDIDDILELFSRIGQDLCFFDEIVMQDNVLNVEHKEIFKLNTRFETIMRYIKNYQDNLDSMQKTLDEFSAEKRQNLSKDALKKLEHFKSLSIQLDKVKLEMESVFVEETILARLLKTDYLTKNIKLLMNIMKSSQLGHNQDLVEMVRNECEKFCTVQIDGYNSISEVRHDIEVALMNSLKSFMEAEDLSDIEISLRVAQSIKNNVFFNLKHGVKTGRKDIVKNLTYVSDYLHSVQDIIESRAKGVHEVSDFELLESSSLFGNDEEVKRQNAMLGEIEKLSEVKSEYINSDNEDEKSSFNQDIYNDSKKTTMKKPSGNIDLLNSIGVQEKKERSVVKFDASPKKEIKFSHKILKPKEYIEMENLMPIIPRKPNIRLKFGQTQKK